MLNEERIKTEPFDMCDYNTQYECRYHRDDVFLETDEVTEEEKEYVRDILYREDMLNIFCFNDYDDLFTKFDDIISGLYKKVCGSEALRECMRLTAAKLISEDEEFGLCLLFSFSYMHLTYECVAAYLENGAIPETTLANLRNELKADK